MRMQVCGWWEENGGKLVANLSKIGSRHKQVTPNSGSIKDILIGQVQGVTWRLEAAPGPRVLIYTITIKLTDPERAPITFTCSPQVGNV